METCSETRPYHRNTWDCYEGCQPGSFECHTISSQLTPARRLLRGRELRVRLPHCPGLGAAGDGDRLRLPETGLLVTCLRVRATTEDTPYAPAVFFRAGVLLASELQLTSSAPAGSAVLGVALLRRVRVSGCYLSASFQGKGQYPVALHLCGHVAVVSGSVVALGGEGVATSGMVRG